MAPSLSAVGRKASQVFRRENTESSLASEASRRFQIVQDGDHDDDDDESSDYSYDEPTGRPPPSLKPLRRRPTVARSILQYVTSNMTQGSSLADTDRSSLGEVSDSWQDHRKENNIAMWRINSELTPMDANHLPISTRPGGDDTLRPRRAGNAFSRGKLPTTQPNTEVYRHQPKPSVPKAGEAGFFKKAGSTELNKPEEYRNMQANTKHARMSSWSSIPSSTDSYRDRQLRGTLVRNASMNWEVVQAQITGAIPDTSGGTTPRPIFQPTTESVRTSDDRAWASFSSSEFAGDSHRRLVQVGHNEWRLVSPSSQNLADLLIPSYQPPHPNQIVPDDLIPPRYVLAGSMTQRNINMDPANNPLWATQFSYPAVQNLNAAVQHASTDIHALMIEIEVLKVEASVNEKKMQGLELELSRMAELLREANLDSDEYREFVAGRERRKLEARLGRNGCQGEVQAEPLKSETSDLYRSEVDPNGRGFASE